MKIEEIQRLINEKEDWINLSNYNYSLNELLEKHPEGVPNKMIARALMMSEEEVDSVVEKAILRMRTWLGVEIDD